MRPPFLLAPLLITIVTVSILVSIPREKYFYLRLAAILGFGALLVHCVLEFFVPDPKGPYSSLEYTFYMMFLNYLFSLKLNPAALDALAVSSFFFISLLMFLCILFPPKTTFLKEYFVCLFLLHFAFVCCFDLIPID